MDFTRSLLKLVAAPLLGALGAVFAMLSPHLHAAFCTPLASVVL